ncbi:ABC-type proline/glycine betaine transport system, permease component [Saccharomonospora marina XMU15]|uniref:ABC-type proline/glycine betaine transport system, permease component n=1 Tax=Saccharomonospora marina XMU15 TaxID=882083 RepID=H5X085_9PSEU|nr:ABC transporter permease [Saccharomonospora marina]EHR48545.1 ABC-type proline/glycine betaine transport system, permease component [Saccharomonospora marina XMU15]
MSVTETRGALGFSTESGSRRTERLRLLVQPAVVVLVAGGVLTWAFTRTNDAIEAESINADVLLTKTWEHLAITAVVTAIVVALAVPLGMVLTRRWARPLAPLFIGIANIGQAAPALGVLVLFFLWSEWEGLWAAALPIAFYSLLPVLRNTIVGIDSVDPALVDAGRGIGMSSAGVLLRIEVPLAVPMILAGLRTALVLAVGTATLAFFVNGGGLGELIDTGYKLNRVPVLVVGAVLAVGLALIVDWLGAVLEEFLGPKGLS